MIDETTEAIRQSLKIEAACLADLTDKADLTQLSEAVEVLTSAERVITCGSGSSGLAAAKFAHTLCCVEVPAKYMAPHEAVHGGMGCVCPEDVVVFVSRGGATQELVPVVDGVRDRGAYVIVLTEKRDSYLASQAHLVIDMHILRESDPINAMATSSFVVTIALFDAIIAGIIATRGFTGEQFGRIHPGGAVGARLGQHKEQQ